MAKIFLNPTMENYFRELDYQDTGQWSKVVDWYEDGKVVLLKNFGVVFDREFFAGLNFPAEKRFKKFKSVNFVKTHFDATNTEMYPDLCELVFGGDRGKINYFAEQVRDINIQARSVLANLFPDYQIKKESTTWRLTDTINENMHVDVYKQDITDHHLRLFVNLDVVPRIWHTSYTLHEMLERYLREMPTELLVDRTPGRICRDLNTAVFGGMDMCGMDGHPRHIGFFDPGDVWLAESRLVSHQIFYGRKALSTEYAVDVASMNNPDSHYCNMVEQSKAMIV